MLQTLTTQARPGDLFFAEPGSRTDLALEIYKEVYGAEMPGLETTNVLGVQLMSAADSEFLGRSPLKSHVSIPWTRKDHYIAKRALSHLQAHHGTDWRKFGHNLSGLILLELDPAARATDACITSITLPGLPYVSLISRKAFVHAPPSLITSGDSYIILAENILHEAAHQTMNLNLVERELFSANFSAEQGPKIPIPWRTEAFYPRDREWPLDRCLHAALVYLTVKRFRERTLKLDASPFTMEHITEAQRNGLYLVRALQADGLPFTGEGRDLINELAARLVECANR